MAISIPTIQKSILQLLNDSEKLDPEMSKEQFSEQFAQIIHDAIISATVTVAPGIPVLTSGGGGATTGNGTGVLS